MNRFSASGLAGVIALAVALGPSPAKAANASLKYVDTACSISPTEFSTWFASGSITDNGSVTFADSVSFPLQNTKCDFYKWAHQMFLWITSPAGGSIVLDSPVFFDVNFNSGGNAVYVPNTFGKMNNAFALRGTKPQKIQPGGQAGGGDTLLSLNDSLVYFGVHANDVYAWFNTAVSNGALPATTPFPSSQSELNAIVQYAAQNGATLPDANALTMELKTAWVDAATVSNLDEYITITSVVPNYQKTSTTQWTIDPKMPSIPKTLALVGIHVVGPVNGHPEMVWATFEHHRNAPDNDFYFEPRFTPPTPLLVPFDSSGTWTFMSNGGSRDGALVAQMTVDGSTGNINATAGNTISQNNVYRVNPWGNAPTPASAENNSELISLNGDIIAMLTMVNDMRANYFQVGGVWTNNGSIPSSPTDSHLVGSLLLANATMETYHQKGSATPDMGCFGCHQSTTSTGTSHLFSPSNVPLVPPASNKQ
ncbi:hypothetical protein C7S18_03950 [Ahniella affigens]|uniref:Cytochrome c domain-containing protein n=1 Tax=Ahniella affigens TaxID=2021234 RepID=A0A2P1PNI7_9GAMM|nr:hypothetical protein [Ahniella affigens]AVP96396.1 hypothetical protein C7S18_03950 [Ahniella affigens]